jgi:hypothetical protein
MKTETTSRWDYLCNNHIGHRHTLVRIDTSLDNSMLTTVDTVDCDIVIPMDKADNIHDKSFSRRPYLTNYIRHRYKLHHPRTVDHIQEADWILSVVVDRHLSFVHIVHNQMYMDYLYERSTRKIIAVVLPQPIGEKVRTFTNRRQWVPF